MTIRKTGADVVVGDKVVVTARCILTVRDIDHNDGHIYLFPVEESSVLLGIGKAAAVEVIA